MVTSALPSTLKTIRAHKGSIQVTKYDSKGIYLLSAGFDRKVKLWNSTSHQSDSDSTTLDTAIQTYLIHSKEILSLDISNDNAKFVSAGSDTQIFLWEVSTNQILRRFSGFFGKVNVSKFVGPDALSGQPAEQNMIVQAGFDKNVRFFDLKSRDYKPVMELKESKDSVMDVVHNGELVVSGGLDGIVRTYDLRMGMLKEDLVDGELIKESDGVQLKQRLKASIDFIYNPLTLTAYVIPSVPITSLSLTSSSTSVLVTTLDSTHRLLDVSDGTLLQSFQGHTNTNFLCRSTFSKNQDCILAGDEKGRVYQWDILSGKEAFGSRNQAGIKAHEKTTLWTEANPVNDKAFITSGSDGLIKIWER